MTDQTHVYAGAARAGAGTEGGLYRRTLPEGGWRRTELPEQAVLAITVDPHDPATVYAATPGGPYRSNDYGGRWDRLGFPAGGPGTWSIAVHPADSGVLFSGTSPAGVLRSNDSGATWRRLPVAMPDRVKMEFPCRVMRFGISPASPDEVYAALEVGGVMRSLDGGERWDDCSAGLLGLAQRPHLRSMIQSDTDTEGMLDAHALCVSPAAPGAVFLAVRMGLFRSAARGDGWEDMEVGRFSPLTYARDIRVSPHDPRVLYACLSPAARSQDGSLYRSDDLGETWRRLDHEVNAESTMMAVALHPRDPDQVHCVSRSGQVFSTLDGGSTWGETRLPEGVRDVYALACA